MLKENLIQHLLSEGKTGTWVELYDQYPYKGINLTNKQKSDAVRKLNKRIQRKSMITTKNPKILVFDIETAPLKSYVWRIWQQNINPLNGMLQSEWFMLTWSAKWLYDDKVMSGKLTPEEALAEDDSRLTKEMWNLFNEANVVIAHNGKKFDVKTLNTRFLKNGLNPPSPYQIIDTLTHARKQFLFESNKLDYLGKTLGLGEKISTSFSLWEGCVNGDRKSLLEMETYNIQDVVLLEEVYLTLRPYIKPHPNLNLIVNNENCACPTCMSENLNWNGVYRTNSASYAAFTCNSCGSQGRSRTNNVSPEIKSNLTISLSK